MIQLWGSRCFLHWLAVHSIGEWVRHLVFSCLGSQGGVEGEERASPDTHSYDETAPMAAGAWKLAGYFLPPDQCWLLVPDGSWWAHGGIHVQLLLLAFTLLCQCLCCIPEMCWVWTWSWPLMWGLSLVCQWSSPESSSCLLTGAP